MPVTIRVRDFQSIKDATIEVKGLTVVTGPNNSGKSALVRAVRGAVQNTRGHGFVRQGTSHCTVDLAFDDVSLQWKKGKKVKPTFIINGGKPLHPGAGVPSEVRDLGIRPIEAGGREVWPQIAPQMTGQVFLLDEPGTVLAEAVADVERAGQLNRALQLAESDKRSALSTLKVRKVDLTKFQKDVDRFEGLDEAVALVEGVEAATAQASKIKKAIEGLSALQERLEAARAIVTNLEGVVEVKVPPKALFDRTRKILKVQGELGQLQVRLQRATGSVAAFSGVGDVEVPSAEGIEAARTTLKDLTSLEDLYRRHQSDREKVNRLGGVETVSIAIDITKATKLVSSLQVVQDFQKKRDTTLKRIADIEAEQVAVEEAHRVAVANYEQLLSEFGECPVCGSDVQEHGGTNHDHATMAN